MLSAQAHASSEREGEWERAASRSPNICGLRSSTRSRQGVAGSVNCGRRQSYLVHSARNVSHSVIVITMAERGFSLADPNFDASHQAAGIRNIVPFCRGPKWGLMANYECKISCFINFDAVSAANKHSACHKSRMASLSFCRGFGGHKDQSLIALWDDGRARPGRLGNRSHTARTTCNFSN